ncbi:MAG: cell division protein FtsL [Paraglaciecola psychrophila]|jgi:cell division protein FtsL
MNALIDQIERPHFSPAAGGSATPRGLMLLCLLLLLALLSSAIAVVYSSYKSRQLFSELQQKSKMAMALEEQWGRLLLEKSTWASHDRIEQLARDKLRMHAPDPSAIVVLEQ